jgi:hypothetical protein
MTEATIRTVRNPTNAYISHGRSLVLGVWLVTDAARI